MKQVYASGSVIPKKKKKKKRMARYGPDIYTNTQTQTNK